ncbi:MAG: preprotein translocase subunit SecG [Verrucomicrobia bacterium]|nr:preprotein translocase subunit SecG [Verrucomicrobiota bacterium]
MGLLIGLLTLVLVLTSLFLILLVLVQLPKKEAGLGMAFGGAATEALFGAGSGNMLTQVTKYATAVFLVLALVLSILRNHEAHKAGRGMAKLIDEVSAAATPAATTAPQTVVPSIQAPGPTGVAPATVTPPTVTTEQGVFTLPPPEEPAP